jgi:hypothetical protein
VKNKTLHKTDYTNWLNAVLRAKLYRLKSHIYTILVDNESWNTFLPCLKNFKTKLAYVLEISAVFHYEPILSLFFGQCEESFIHIMYMSSIQIIFMYKYFQDVKNYLSFQNPRALAREVALARGWYFRETGRRSSARQFLFIAESLQQNFPLCYFIC